MRLTVECWLMMLNDGQLVDLGGCHGANASVSGWFDVVNVFVNDGYCDNGR